MSNLPKLRRILVTGANGAGKTIFAKAVGDLLDLPIVHNDALALLDGWQYAPKDQRHAALTKAFSGESWVIEGGPSILTHPHCARAQLFIWLDLPPGLRFRRVLLRSWRYFGRTRPELPQGNREWPGAVNWPLR